MHRLALTLILCGLGCGEAIDAAPQAPSGYVWALPAGFPTPRVPRDNPMTAQKVALGRHLFYDTRLSLEGSASCATCHRQELAFTDGRARGVGVTGEQHPRGAMSLANVAYAATLNWSSPIERTLERQALTPMFGEHPVELGLSGREGELLATLRADADTAARFEAAFPEDSAPVSVHNITRALASFQRTLISGDAPYDRYVRGERGAISEAARRGRELFFSERLECFHCHGGFSFADGVDHEGLVFNEPAFHNNGLYNVAGTGDYPLDNSGLYAFTGTPEDRGKFKAPTLRNIAVTAPYMHDGSLATLEEVVDHYAQGGRVITEGPLAGDGRAHPNKSAFVAGFVITDAERAELIAFLESLTDETFLNDPAHGDPFAPGARP